MFDDNRDKEMQRNQLIAIVLMTLMLVGYFSFFAPKPPVTPPKPAPVAVPAQSATKTAGTPASPGEMRAEPGTQTTAWLPLPAVAAPPATPVEDEIILENAEIRLGLTKVGARIKTANVLLQKQGAGAEQQLAPDQIGLQDADAIFPLGLRFTDTTISDAVDSRRFELKSADARTAVFELTIPGFAVIRKTFTLDEAGYGLKVNVEYQNLEATPRTLGMDQTPAFVLNWGPNVQSGDILKIGQTLVWRKDGALTSLATSSLSPVEEKVMPGVEWVAIKSAYFVVAMKSEFEGSQLYALGNAEKFRMGMAAPRFEVQPGAVQSHQFDIYVGPCKDKALAQGWDTLPSVLRFFDNGPMDAFAKLLLKILNWSHDSLYPNYGLAIIILTIIVRLVTLPLTLKSMRSMKKMQMLAPEIEALKAKYGEDANEMNKKMMELYRERGVNPIGGCFPMLLQMPVFIALYRMLMIAFELRGAPFVFWISDLSQPDRMLHLSWMPVLPFVGAALQDVNLLPVLMGISMVVSQKMMPTTAASMNPQQKFMMNFMPVFFSILCYSLASGLSLYILTSTVLGIVQQKLISPGEMTPKTPRKKVVGKGQHFYTAAKARQRQMAKEMRQERQKQARQNKTETKDND